MPMESLILLIVGLGVPSVLLPRPHRRFTLRPAWAVGVAIIALSSTAKAQDADGWDVEVDAERKITVAAVRYETGQALMVQCRDGELSTILTGLPTPSSPLKPLNGVYSRRLETGSADALRAASWRSSPDGASAFRTGDARRVRGLKAIDRFTVRTAPAPDAPARRLAFDLPADASGIDQVLSACGRPLVDPRDELRDVTDIVKVDQAHRGLNPGDNLNLSSVEFEYSCIVAPDSRVRDCVIESEHPMGRGIGDRLLRSAPRARFNFGDDPESLVGGIFYVNMGIVARIELLGPA